ncbi:DUF1361 domain-containing protein [Flavobacterium sp. HJJ]|uniref:DUF1361 domain-containing protein n=1 Tax=Flavobacterium sp. HJJ TaxID=2783792 RepID=UPI00188A7ECB|nr:DUF1361 domain-containing protein [Flavobacterium sp. HJJ]MBF4473604.1 DUF1361 domain-containing protein [Flavobacterium sp. HJJ]
MQLITRLFNSNRKINSVLFLFTAYCLILLVVRAKLTNTVYLFFLVWNLFLAFIPYLFISCLKTQISFQKSKIKTLALLFLWLLFLPNSFYILTDLIHLSQSENHLFWFDLVVISSYALIGFTLGIISLIEFENIIRTYTSTLIINLLIPVICFLCGIGIYLGRILRYNSWDILSSPIKLFQDTLTSLLSVHALLFSFYFGVYIYLFYSLRKIYSAINH